VGNASKVNVTMHDGRTFVGEVHSTDKASDLALVRILNPQNVVFPIARIGSSHALRAGEWVVALGSPLMLQNTVTTGIVSATARQSSELGLPQLRTEYIQTDAAINKGNSGGPLVDLEGRVIGINTMKVAGAGISFAIPIDTAWHVIRQLRDNRRVVRPYLGFSMVNATRTDVPEPSVVVVDVKPNSPAAKSGLKPGDVLVRFDGRPVRTTNDIFDRLGYEIGRRIEIEIKRGLQTQNDDEPAQSIRVDIETSTAVDSTSITP